MKIILLLSVVALIACALIYGFTTKRDYNYALGLPKGSVRGIIAISLLALFVGTSIYFFDNLGNEIIHLKHISQEEFLSFPKDAILTVTSSNDTVRIDSITNQLVPYYDIRYIVENDNKNELSKQILSILGTLIVAVSSFYFGSRATEQGGKIVAEIFNRNQSSDDSTSNIILIEGFVSIVDEVVDLVGTSINLESTVDENVSPQIATADENGAYRFEVNVKSTYLLTASLVTTDDRVFEGSITVEANEWKKYSSQNIELEEQKA